MDSQPALQIFNTLTRQKETLVPLVPGHLGVYVCGPTVYDLSHLGHARVYVAFDTIVRYLRRHFDVTYVRNFTDVDDKIIRRAQEAKEAPEILSARCIEAFRADMAQLGVLPADVEPKVTEHVEPIVRMIEVLIAKGHAYSAGGDVYYAVDKFATYGRLGRRTLEDMEAGARVEVSAHKRHPMDFVLWKAAKPGEPQWPSPWGAGRPGWHIECSAMARQYLGDQFDIHGGGRDLIFPHHENEVAQSEAANGVPFASLWMHNGMINVGSQKMSKSLGNFSTVRALLQAYEPQTLRYYLLATHYRSSIQFTPEALADADQRVQYIYLTLARLRVCLGADAEVSPAAAPAACAAAQAEGTLDARIPADLLARFDASLADDFNTPQALGELAVAFKVANDLLDRPREPMQDQRSLVFLNAAVQACGEVLGLFVGAPVVILAALQARRQGRGAVDPARIEALIGERTAARADRNFGRADAIRQELEGMGVVLKDSPKGTTWLLG